MDAWYTGHHRAHHGHAKLIGGHPIDSHELPIRAERVRDFEGGCATDEVDANTVAVLLGFERD
jgi:hypothetical protein